MKNSGSPRILFILFLIVVGACSRFIPHPFNFTGIAAIALFSGAKMNNRFLAFIAPMLAMLISDIAIGFHATKDMIAVYGCFAATVFLGILIREKQSVLSIALASLASSILFYLVTNFSVWPGNSLYTQDLSGLITSYMAGIPFFRNEMLGDLFYNAVFFGGFYFAETRFPSLFGKTLVTVKK